MISLSFDVRENDEEKAAERLRSKIENEHRLDSDFPLLIFRMFQKLIC